ncbi:hemoglobin/transferrin/lactoferrin receptor protein [Ulvibacter sp. MAR_2010_11]|uniref:TonB-dependent receptor n=1 Tax=Ulvibacter sp. MAR_2010_11 TaxID=1250229 RepID=UPI000C2BEBED|nr:TonB-dependent receptor [Ulvibacter sp. MAR_2010_11]PKA83067.1 hemoglobin/transferrin/lactoferrin receptor protein [Ulvibacter sp. MAR_2010_11]
MKKLLLLTFGVLLCNLLWAQKIQVVDDVSQEPIVGAAIYNDDKSKSGVTDFDGFVDISHFTENERIYFQHISHVATSFVKRDIVASNNTVIMAIDASTLDEVVLSVAKFGQQKKEVPQQIVSINAGDIQFANPQTSADLLESSGQVFVQKSQLGGGSPMIRGFSTNRLLITLDGVRFNTAIYRSGNVQNVIAIDPFSIETTEVILGPGSVIYGSDAIGGVMNFYTKRPKFSFQDGLKVGGSATARYSTANEEKTGHFDINLGAKEWAFLTSVTYSDFSDLKMGKHGPDDYLRPDYVEIQNGEDVMVTNPDPMVQVPTGYHQINAMQKVRFMPSKEWDFDLGLFYTTTGDYSRYDRLTRRRNGNLRSAEWYYGPQEWMAGNLQAKNKAYNDGIYDEAIVTLSYQRNRESRHDRDFGETTLFESEETVDAYSGAFDFEKDLTRGKLHYGIEYVYNKVGSVGSQTDITTGDSQPDASRYPDGSTWQSMAAYGSLLYKLTENLAFQGGLRYNHILLNATFDDTFYDFPFSDANIDTGALTGSAGLALQASEILGLKANFSTAFRAPNVDDVGKIFDSEPGSVVVPNPNLKPEYATNGELGASFDFGKVVKLEVAGFYTVLSDALVRRDFNLNGQTEIEYQGELSTIQAIQNAAKAEVYGFEAGVEVNFCKEVQLSSHYTITDGYEEDDDGIKNPLRHAAPQFGNTHLRFKTNKWRLDAFTEYNGQFDFKDLAPSQAANDYLYALDGDGNPYSPRWYTVNFGAQYSVTEAILLNATLENITNQRYRQYSSGISAPGTNLIVAATYTF